MNAAIEGAGATILPFTIFKLPRQGIRMTTNEILTIAAIFLGPITALMVQRELDRRREARRRQQEIFSTIWATRSWPQRLQYRHVEALNMVGISFAKKSSVVEAWNEYLDKLNRPDPEAEAERPRF